MKRAADTPPRSDRPSKLRRIDMADIFNPDNELRAVESLSEHIDPTQWIGGKLYMVWPAVGGSLKFRLPFNQQQLHIVMSGPNSSQMVLRAGNLVKLSLINATVHITGARTGLLPFELRYGDQVILEKDGEVLDLRTGSCTTNSGRGCP
jgi:hypothetical protein